MIIILFLQRHKIVCPCSHFVNNSQIGMNIKQKVRTKIRQMSIDIFSNQTL